MNESDSKIPPPPEWAANAVRRAVQKYNATMADNRKRLTHHSDAPAMLNRLLPRVRGDELAVRRALLSDLQDEITVLAAAELKRRLMEALVAGFDDGSLPPSETALVFEIELPRDFNDDFFFYEQQLTPLAKRVGHLEWRDVQRAIIEEIRALNALEGWRAKNPSVAAFFVQVLVSFLASGPGKRGRKHNETALSVERRLVNDYLPWLKRVQAANGVVFKRREEVALLRRLARANGLLADLDDAAVTKAITKAVKNWADTNPEPGI